MDFREIFAKLANENLNSTQLGIQRYRPAIFIHNIMSPKMPRSIHFCRHMPRRHLKRKPFKAANYEI
jgi:hypothetical protein